jgi:hypothetical protein
VFSEVVLQGRPIGGKSIAATQPTTKNPRTGVEKMNAVLAKEEETTQKLFELKKTKVKVETEKHVARVKAKSDVKMQPDKLKANLAIKKMEFDFRLQMAQLGQVNQAGPSASFSSPVGATPSSGWSDAGSTTPSAFLGELEPGLNPYGYDFSHYDANN